MTCYVGNSTTPNDVCDSLGDHPSGAYPHSAITDVRALPGAAIGGASSFCQLSRNVALLLVCSGRSLSSQLAGFSADAQTLAHHRLELSHVHDVPVYAEPPRVFGYGFHARRSALSKRLQ